MCSIPLLKRLTNRLSSVWGQHCLYMCCLLFGQVWYHRPFVGNPHSCSCLFLARPLLSLSVRDWSSCSSSSFWHDFRRSSISPLLVFRPYSSKSLLTLLGFNIAGTRLYPANVCDSTNVRIQLTYSPGTKNGNLAKYNTYIPNVKWCPKYKHRV